MHELLNNLTSKQPINRSNTKVTVLKNYYSLVYQEKKGYKEKKNKSLSNKFVLLSKDEFLGSEEIKKNPQPLHQKIHKN